MNSSSNKPQERARIWFPELLHYMILLSSLTKNLWDIQKNKKVWPSTKINEWIETVSKEAQMLDLLVKNFKSAF